MEEESTLDFVMRESMVKLIVVLQGSVLVEHILGQLMALKQLDVLTSITSVQKTLEKIGYVQVKLVAGMMTCSRDMNVIKIA